MNKVFFIVIVALFFAMPVAAEVKWNQITDPDGSAAISLYIQRQHGLSEREAFINFRIAHMFNVLNQDREQTLNIKNLAGHEEANPILGKHPNDNEVNTYFILSSASAAILFRKMSDPWNIVLIESLRLFEKMLVSQNNEVERKAVRINSVPIAISFSTQF